jgi:hypothetical protein
LVKAAEIGQAKAETVNFKLKAYRQAKLRKRDLHDLNKLHVAVNDLGEEIDAITHADDLYIEHWGHSQEANAVDQQRHICLRMIREKVAKLKYYGFRGWQSLTTNTLREDRTARNRANTPTTRLSLGAECPEGLIGE